MFQVQAKQLSEATLVPRQYYQTSYPLPNEYLDSENPLEVRYQYDCNIFEVHQYLCQRAAHAQTQLPRLQAELTQNVLALQQNLYRNQRRKYLTQYHELLARYNDIVSGTSWSKYISRVSDYLKSYASLQIQGRVCSLRIDRNVVSSNDLERLKVVSAYLTIAEEYGPIRVIREQTLNAICPTCGTLQKDFIDDGDISSCPQCGYVRDVISYENRNSENGGSFPKNDYENRCNFYRAILCYQGKQNVQIPDSLYSDLDAFFARVSGPSRQQIMQAGFQVFRFADGQTHRSHLREGSSLNLMLTALSETGHSKHYPDVNLIMNRYWACELPNLQSYENALMELYDRTQEIYAQIPSAERGRDAALNKQFRLYVQLRALGYRCSTKEFKIQKTRESLESHERNWRFMCAKTNTPFYGVI